MSKIEWTGKTWNPISGCSRVSAGCQNCYAETMTKRLAAMGNTKYQGLLNDQNRFNGVVKFDEQALLKPLSVKKPTTYFVNSMSDLFHENVKDEWIDQVFAVMALARHHTFQILTKRPERMRDYLSQASLEKTYRVARPLLGNVSFKDGLKLLWGVTAHQPDKEYPLNNVWLGVSCENQKTADERIPLLLDTPAAIRFLSCEPLLGEVDLFEHLNAMEYSHDDGKAAIYKTKISWVIVGGESGAGARRCRTSWIRSIVRQSQTTGVPVFVKQMGAFVVDRNDSLGCEDNQWNFEDYVFQTEDNINGYKEEYQGADVRIRLNDKKGGDITEFPRDLQIREMPKIEVNK